MPLVDHFATYCRGLLSNLQRQERRAHRVGLRQHGAGVARCSSAIESGTICDCATRLQQRIVSLHAPAPGVARAPDDLASSAGSTKPRWPKRRQDSRRAAPMVRLPRQDRKLRSQRSSGLRPRRFHHLLTRKLYLPKAGTKIVSAAASRHSRCSDYQPKTAIAVAEVKRALGNGLHFDWLVFDEGYGKDPSFLLALDALGQNWIARFPKASTVGRLPPQYQSPRKEFASKRFYNVVRWSLAFISQKWRTIICPRQSVEPTAWDVKAAQVHLVHNGRPTDRTYWLIVAWNRATDEHKYFVSNAPPRTKLDLLLKVAFRRARLSTCFVWPRISRAGSLRGPQLCRADAAYDPMPTDPSVPAEQTLRLNAELAATAALPAPRHRKKNHPPRRLPERPRPPAAGHRRS